MESINANNETALLRAVKEGNVMVTKVLVNNGADISAHDLVSFLMCKTLLLARYVLLKMLNISVFQFLFLPFF